MADSNLSKGSGIRDQLMESFVHARNGLAGVGVSFPQYCGGKAVRVTESRSRYLYRVIQAESERRSQAHLARLLQQMKILQLVGLARSGLVVRAAMEVAMVLVLRKNGSEGEETIADDGGSRL